jgi:UDP-hydrolysing UDP-N-acetyl-D-glucosamine 2-epimerase
MTYGPVRRRIGVVTTGRADYGVLRSVFAALAASRGVDPVWLVAGAHLTDRFGGTLDELRADGWESRTKVVDAPIDGDTPAAAARSMAGMTAAFGRVFDAGRFDLLVALGDRFETLAVVAASVPFRLAVAHLHGGELTEGAFDDGVRHAITKLSHLHFVAHAVYARRVRQLGEEPWRIVVSGAPGLDGLVSNRKASLADLERDLGGPVDRTTVVLTYHPETQRPHRTLDQLEATLGALDRLDVRVIATAPNADPGRDECEARIKAFVGARAGRVFVPSLGHARYGAVMSRAGAMVGNSSSGIIEAPSFGLPVVNVGGRQRGRVRAANVIDINGSRSTVERAVRRALSPAFRRRASRNRNPFGDGKAGARIAAVLQRVPLDERLLVKRFVDLKGRR